MRLIDNIEEKLWSYNQKNIIVRWIEISIIVFRVIYKSRLKHLAASLTYTTLLALVPVLAILFYIFKTFKIDSFIKKIINEFLEPLGNSGIELSNYLYQFIDNAQIGFLGGIGIIFLLYSVYQAFQKIEYSLNYIWRIGKQKKIVKKLIGFIWTFLSIILFSMVVLVLNIFIHKINLDINEYGNKSLTLIYSYIIKIISIIITAFIISILYKYIPNTKVSFKSAFYGGIFCAILWLPLTFIFTKIISLSTGISIIYSSFASIILLLIWLNTIWLLFLSGGLVSYLVQNPEVIKKTRR